MKKLVDEKGRLFGKISLIDFIVIVMVLVLAAAIYVRFFGRTETARATDETFVYQVQVTNLREASVDNLRVGDKLFSAESGTEIGTITDVAASDAMLDVTRTDGTFAYTKSTNRKDVVLTLEASGVISEGRYYAGRTFELNVNDKVDLCTKYCEFEGTIWSIER